MRRCAGFLRDKGGPHFVSGASAHSISPLAFFRGAHQILVRFFRVPGGVTDELTVTQGEAGRRLDTVVSTWHPALSRSRAGHLIREGRVTVNGSAKKASYVVKGGDVVHVEIPPSRPVSLEPEALELSILFEDRDLIVVNKPPGLVVHPGAGHHQGTLVNALLHHCDDLQGIGGELRPGIVHRLDKDTSGCLVVAKQDRAHDALSLQFKARRIQKRYLALVYGRMAASSGMVDLPIGRHPIDRKKMSTTSRHSRSSETRWEVKEPLGCATLLEVDLKTGRTHQIRVHCAAIGHPVVGDRTYGGTDRWKDAHSKALQEILKSADRQMLHAWKLSFTHPRTDQTMDFESPIPEDMESILKKLRDV